MQLCDVPFLQVEPNTKLFPAVFVLPSSQNMIQFELGKLKVSYKESLHSAEIPKIKTAITNGLTVFSITSFVILDLSC